MLLVVYSFAWSFFTYDLLDKITAESKLINFNKVMIGSIKSRQREYMIYGELDLRFIQVAYRKGDRRVINFSFENVPLSL